MKAVNCLCIFTLLMGLDYLDLEAQPEIPIHQWRTHFNHRDARIVAIADTRVYCSSANSLFYFDQTDNSLNKLSKIDGFSGTEISAMAFHEPSGTLLIGYQDGGVDLLSQNQIGTINTIKEAEIPGSKRPNQIIFSNELAYAVGDFGVAVVDIGKTEIKEAYTSIGLQGSSLSVTAASILNDSLFLATDQGIIVGALDPQINLQDFANWHRFDTTADGLPAIPYLGMGKLGSSLVVGGTDQKLYQYENGNWQQMSITVDQPIVSINTSSDQLLICLSDRLLTIDTNGKISIIEDPLIRKPFLSVIDQGGVLWIADNSNGLVSNFEGGFQNLFPSGPFSDNFWGFSTDKKGDLIVVSGGYDNSSQPLGRKAGFYNFSQGDWINYNQSAAPATNLTPEISDLVDVVFNPQDNSYYFASLGYGLMKWDGSTFTIVDENTPGSPLINIAPPGRNTQISALATDVEGSIWVANYGAVPPLHRYQPLENSWQSFGFELEKGRYVRQVLVASNGNKWLRLDRNQGGGILIFDEQGNREKFLSSTSGSGGLPNRNVISMAEDLDQSIWVGTEEGLAVYPFAFDLLDQEQIDAVIPTIEGRPLLKDERINCIEIDGGNRKWIGTDNGAWLFSENGDSVIYNFTQGNSSLPSNRIRAIHIQPHSGEVFFASDNGTVSFREGATSALEFHQQVKIFPNPVTRDFSGEVGISGLARNAIIKITDVSGKLIKESRAQGGTALWNVADYHGRRVTTGVYLIFSASADGTETFVGKVAVIN